MYDMSSLKIALARMGCLGILLLVLAGLIGCSTPAKAPDLVKQTLFGPVAGIDTGNNSWAWKGIPYAKPPVGDLRWKAPVDPDKWQTIRQSSENFSSAFQPVMSPNWIPGNKVVGSEDCLYLNVFRPRTDTRNLPVLVWIHGGANYFGEAGKYDGSILAGKQNMVVVIIQYRLGPLGFFTHPAINQGGSQEDKSGNYGTLDTIQAVKWVKNNIGAFGGDPNNITVGGQSAGGFNTLNIMISPLAKGTFSKAFVMSAGGSKISVEKGVARANALIDKLLVLDGTCADNSAAAAYHASMTDTQVAAYVRSKPGEMVQKAAMNSRGSVDAAGPVIDGYVLPGTASSIIAMGNYNKVPILIGSTEYEIKAFLPLYGAAIPTSSGKTWFNSFNVLGVIPPPMTLSDVFASDTDKAFYEACGKYPSLSWKAFNVDSVARALRQNQDDIYCYWFKWNGIGADTPGFDFIYEAGHATDVPFFMGWSTDVFALKSFSVANQAGRLALQDAMMDYLGQFAATGNPNKQNSKLPAWEKWSNAADGPKSIVFNADLNKAIITMMNQEVIKADVLAQIDSLPLSPQMQGIIKNFIFF
jgi:para-nitrobenzyl esterase